MENRESQRLEISDITGNYVDKSDIYFEFDLDEKITGSITDISMKGIGFEILKLNDNQVKKILESDGMFLKIHILTDSILVGVKIMWSLIKEENNNKIFEGGAAINIISPEDKLKLTSLIDKIRNSISK